MKRFCKWTLPPLIVNTLTGVAPAPGSVPGADAAKFVEIANKAKVGCPVSKLKAKITMEAKLGG